jgi:hypothetical protein
MLPDQINTIHLSEEDYQRIRSFESRFGSDDTGVAYGKGHLLFACYASFPLMLSPDLANLLWQNFKNYSVDGKPAIIHRMAIADLLQSEICRQIGHHRYELLPSIRSYLLALLKDGKWLSTFGIKINSEVRLYELASFVWQYMEAKNAGYLYDGAGFQRLNEWASLAYLDPGKLAGRLLAVVLDNDRKDNRHGQLWLNTQMDRIRQQYDSNILGEKTSRESLKPFYSLYYYSNAKRAEVLKKGSDASFEYASHIEQDLSTGEGRQVKVVRLKLSKEVAERVDRKVKNVQRVLSFFYGADNVSDTVPFMADLSEIYNNKSSLFTPPTFFSRPVGVDILKEGLGSLLDKVHPEDIVFLYFDARMDSNTNSVYIDGKPELLFPSTTKPESGVVVVLFFESLAGEETWAADYEILFSSVPGDGQNMNISSGYSITSAAARFLKQTPNLSYRDMLLFMRFEIGNAGASIDQRPVCWSPPLMQQWSFFTRAAARPVDTHLIVYDSGSGGWRLIEEDFKRPTLSTTGRIYEYGNAEVETGGAGEFHNGQSPADIRFSGGTTSLDPTRLYLVREERGRIPVQLKVEFSDADLKELQSLAMVSPKGLFQWNVPYPAEADQLENYDELLIIDIETSSPPLGYLFSYLRRMPSGHRRQWDWPASDISSLGQILRAVGSYEYLRRLQLPEDFFSNYRRLEVYLSYRWNGWEGDDGMVDVGSAPLEINKFYILNGKILFYLPEFEVYNAEKFPVFFDLYVLSSDLGIKRLDITRGQPIPAGGRLRGGLTDQQLMQRVAKREIEIQIKLLVSRDVILPDFSQEGIPLAASSLSHEQ